jgi:putative hemolysin
MLVEIIVILALVLLNAFLALSELAVVSSRRGRLQSLARQRYRGSRVAMSLLEDPTELLSTVQIGITLIGVLAGAFGGATVADRLAVWLEGIEAFEPYSQPLAIGAVVLIVTYVSLVGGELVPKRIALNDPERVASAVAPIMRALARAAAPAVWLLGVSTDAILRLLGVARTRDLRVTEDEVRMLVAEGTRVGVFMPKEREMIEGVLRLADRTVRAIMTPRADVAWLDADAGPQEIATLLAARRLSRFPVCRGSVDNPLGILHTKDLARVALTGGSLALADIIVPPLVVVEGTPVLRLLESFRREGVHMAVVVDEYGATQGIVTLADVIEAVAGTFPELGTKVDPSLVKRDDGTWLVDGGVPVDEFEDRLGVRGLRGSGDFETVAGYALQRLGRLPVVGDRLFAPSGEFEIVSVDGRRIDKLVFTPREDEEG